MLKLRKVAVTGRLGVGKSAVCQFFKELGAQTANADTIVHHLLSSSPKIQHQVIELLGEGVVVEGAIDRSKIAELVFADQTKLKQLEAILHPAVRETLQNQFQEAAKNKIPLIVVEVPLLYEANFDPLFDQAIVVTSSKERSSFIDAEKRLEHRLSVAELLSRCDYHIQNDKTLEELKQQIQTLYQKLISYE